MEITPLFALEAEKLFTEGNIEESLLLCLEGIAAYPDYPAAYLLLCKIYIDQNDIDSAIEILEEAKLLFPTNKQILSLSDELVIKNYDKLIISNKNEDLKSENIQMKLVLNSEFIQDSSRSEFLKASNLKLIPGLEFSPLKIKSSMKKNIEHSKNLPEFPTMSFFFNRSNNSNKSNFDSIDSNSEFYNRNNKNNINKMRASDLRDYDTIPPELENDELVRIARSIEKLTINPNIQDPKISSLQELERAATKQKITATETLAKIYESQHHYGQALEAYKELSKMHPDKISYYETKINKIKEISNSMF